MIASAVRALGLGRETSAVQAEAVDDPAKGAARLLLRATCEALGQLLPLDVRASRGTVEAEARALLFEAGEAGMNLADIVLRIGGSTISRRAVALVVLAGILPDLEALPGRLAGRLRFTDQVLATLRARVEREAEEAQMSASALAAAKRERAEASRLRAAAEDDARARLLHLRSHRAEPCGWRRCWTCSAWPNGGVPGPELARHSVRRCEAGCPICSGWPVTAREAA